MGLENSGVVYALWGYSSKAPDELSFKEGDMVTILQKPEGVDWWWASLCGREGFIPNNYFGVRYRPDAFSHTHTHTQITLPGSESSLRNLLEESCQQKR